MHWMKKERVLGLMGTVSLVLVVWGGVTTSTWATSKKPLTLSVLENSNLRKKEPLKSIRTNITIDAASTMGSVSPTLFGANGGYLNNGGGMYDPINHQVYPGFQNAYKDVGLKTMRYPGGARANLFWWQRAVGNGNGLNPDSGLNQIDGSNAHSAQPDTFNLDQALKFTGNTGTALTYVYNMGNGNPTDAANLVEYLDGTDTKNPYVALRIANGHPVPFHVKYFEIGNEMYIPKERYWLAGIPGGLKGDYQSYYVNGGDVSFTKQPVVLKTSWSSLATSYKSTGSAGKQVYAAYAPIDPGSDTVYVNGIAWTRVTSFSGYGATAKVYEINPTTGEITFGDGTHGKVPPSGDTVSISYSAYHYGYKDYITAMKAVDPNIYVLSCLHDSKSITDLNKAGVHFDGMSIHLYSYGIPNGLTTKNFYGDMMHTANINDNAVSSLVHSLHADPYSNGIVYPSEYGFYAKAALKSNNPNFLLSLGESLYIGKEAMSFLQDGIPVSSKYKLVGDWSSVWQQQGIFSSNYVSGGSYNFTESTTAQMFKVLTHMTGTTLLTAPSIINMPTYSYTLKNQTYNNNALDVVATRTSSGDVFLLVLNEDPSNSYTPIINLHNYAPNRSATVWQLGENNTLDAYDVAGHPLTVRIHSSFTSISGQSFKYTFPAHSITAIHLSGRVSGK